MKIIAVFALTFLTNSMLALAQESDEGNAVLQTERDLATAYLKSDTDGIAQGVMEDYTLTNSMGKITTRADDIGEALRHQFLIRVMAVVNHAIGDDTAEQ